MAIVFNPSKGFTLGVELEMQLIDPVTFKLVNSSGKILEATAKDPLVAGSVKHELMESNLEVITGICKTTTEVKAELSSKLKRVIEIAGENNILISGGGTHPFSLASDQRITDDVRYARLKNLLQLVARNFSIFGMHVHVGVDGAEKSIYVLNRMIYYLPYILALSANSPFWEGENSGLRSYRTKIFETLPIAGLPFYFKGWDDYTTLAEDFIATGTIESIRELWWDVRPHPDFGTIEVRICDTPSTLKDVLAITAFIQALVKRFSDDFDAGVEYKRPHSWVIRENKWRACRFGLDGEFIAEDGTATVKTRDLLRDIVGGFKREADELGSAEDMQGVFDIIDNGTGAIRQLKSWKEDGDMKRVVS
ncbi:MAG: glutamate--cysteine ligase, partial [Proteobacteria bacterium]|nr:glutamate--cysteine ligase [Pseudomonadota bacterium]